MFSLFKFLSVLIALLGVSVCFLPYYQDADLTLHFYEKFGVQPCSVLHNKVVWITGASSGIGEYLAYELAKCGCKLVLSARRKDKLEKVKDKCAGIAIQHDKTYNKDKNIMVLPLDVREFTTHRELTSKVLTHFKQIDVFVNNAGRAQRSWVKDIPLDIEQELLDINLVGAMSLTKAVLPNMLERNQGQIMVVSSVFGKYGFPYEATYAASKFGLHGYFDSLRIELSDTDISVQLVCPGPVKSNITGNSFTQFKNKSFKETTSYYSRTAGKMPTERCAYLMAVCMANYIDEAWISTHPSLSFVYMSQYMPRTFQWYAKRAFRERMKRIFFPKS